MSAAFVPSWPGSRVLVEWWRQLAQRKPHQVRLCRLLIHRVEALVRVRKRYLLDRWQRALLGLADARVPYSGELVNCLSDLHLDAQILGRLVWELTENGLLHRNGTGLWQMTPAGRHALQTGAMSVTAEERRTFTFVDNSALGRPPHFLPMELGPIRPAGAAPSEAVGCLFEAAFLQACLEQPPQWKERFRFPTEIEAVLLPQFHDMPAADWRRVLLDAVEQRFLVFIHSRESSTAPLQGFAADPEGWVLTPEPLVALAAGWEEALPDLAGEPSSPMWRQAWRSWAHPRSLPPAEVEACRLERVDHRLLVYAPPRLLDRLRATRSDAIKQEAWLLAGEGRTRTAAQIELHPL